MICVHWRLLPIWLTVALLVVGCAPLATPTEMDASSGSTMEEFATGAMLPGVFDVDVGPDGTVYVASELERSLIGVDPQSGAVVARHDTVNDTPHAMTMGPDGSLYWSSFFSLNVCRFDDAGEKTCQAMPVDTWGLDFAPDGRLFATADAHVESLYEVDPQLDASPQHVAHLGSLIAHFAFGPDGKVYAPLLLEGTILRVDVDADPVSIETVAEGLTLPWAVAFDSSGQMYVAASADNDHNEILRLDPATGEREVVGRLPAGYHSIIFGADDRLFASHFDEGALYELLPDGELKAITEPGITGPGGLAVLVRPDGGESLFVGGWNTLHELDAATGETRNHWRTTWFPGAVAPPRTVASHGDDLLIAKWADQWGGSSVQVWDPENGEPLAQEGGFAWAANAIPFQDEIIVVDLFDGVWRVLRCAAADLTACEPIGGDTLKQPVGLAADEANLWATDYAGGTLAQLATDGAYLEEPLNVVSGLDRPEGLAIGPDGRLLVIETGTGRLLSVDPSTQDVETIAEGFEFQTENPTSIGPSGPPPHYVFSDVAVAPSGAIYVSDDGANVIYRIPDPMVP